MRELDLRLRQLARQLPKLERLRGRARTLKRRDQQETRRWASTWQGYLQAHPEIWRGDPDNCTPWVEWFPDIFRRPYISTPMEPPSWPGGLREALEPHYLEQWTRFWFATPQRRQVLQRARDRQREEDREWDRQRRLKIRSGEQIDRNAVFRRDNGLCQVCGRRVSVDNFHLDHRRPLAQGGEHVLSNLQIAHPSCNQNKGALAF